MTVGEGKFRYEVCAKWLRPPADWKLGVIPAVACDSSDRVYLYCRGDHPLVVFSPEGDFIKEWGKGILNSAHGLWIDDRNFIYCTDHTSHSVFVFNSSGELVRTFGTPNEPGAPNNPFNQPTDSTTLTPRVDSSAESLVFVSDGYGNRRVHKFSQSGRLLRSWGTEGSGPGQFRLPHCVRVDRFQRVWVCDRENDRIQIFDIDGDYLEERKGLKRPCSLFIDPKTDVVYVAELERRVSIWTLDGALITHWGGGKISDRPGEFVGGPHGIWVDSQGNLYVTEVFAEERVQKFVPVG